MKRFLSFSLLGLFVCLFGVENSLLADIITPYYTEYEAEAETYYDDNQGNWGEFDYSAYQSSPPVEVSTGISNSNYSGSAYAYTDTDGTNFEASAQAWNSLTDPESYVENYSYVDGYWEFTAEQSSLYVSFDYQMNVSAQVDYYDSEGTYAYAYAELYFKIYDLDDDVTVYSWNPVLEVEAYADAESSSDSDSLSGSFSEYIDLIVGHDYAIYIDPYWIEADVYGNGTASAFAKMTNVTLAAVPIPSAFFLLGGGLLGALALSRKYR